MRLCARNAQSKHQHDQQVMGIIASTRYWLHMCTGAQVFCGTTIVYGMRSERNRPKQTVVQQQIQRRRQKQCRKNRNETQDYIYINICGRCVRFTGRVSVYIYIYVLSKSGSAMRTHHKYTWPVHSFVDARYQPLCATRLDYGIPIVFTSLYCLCDFIIHLRLLLCSCKSKFVSATNTNSFGRA